MIEMTAKKYKSILDTYLFVQIKWNEKFLESVNLYIKADAS